MDPIHSLIIPTCLAFIIVLLITLFTTGYHAFRAAKGNPIEFLRYE